MRRAARAWRRRCLHTRTGADSTAGAYKSIAATATAKGAAAPRARALVVTAGLATSSDNKHSQQQRWQAPAERHAGPQKCTD